MNEKSNRITRSVIAVVFLLIIGYVFIKNIETSFSSFKALSEGTSLSEINSKFENQFNSNFPNKTYFVDINGLGHRVLLQRQMSDVYLMANGHATTLVGQATSEGIQANADSVISFSNWFKAETGGNFIYVQVPWKNTTQNDYLPGGLTDFSNVTADTFLSLINVSVDTIDLRKEIALDGKDFYSLYLQTEHHWNAYGGFYAFQKICRYMEDTFGTEIDPKVLDLENYNQDILQDHSLGHYGQKTGQFFAGYDDFPVIYPKFETQQSCTIVHKDITRTGSFYDAVFDLDFLSASKRNRGLYGMYIGGDFPLVIHESETAQNPETVMLFIDSFGTVVESYLSTAFKNVVAVDLRWVLRTGMESSAVDFIEQFQPDTVIVMFNPNQIGSAESEQFIYGLPSE